MDRAIEPLNIEITTPVTHTDPLSDKMDKATTRSLFVLSLAFFIQATTALSVVGGFTAISAEWKLSTTEIALLVTAFGVTFAVGAPIFQILVGRWVRRTQILTGLGIMALGAVTFALAPSYALLFIGRVVMGLGAALISPVLSALGSSLVKPHQAGAALAVVLMGYSIASVIGVPMSSWVSLHFGARWLYGILALGILITAALIAYLVRDRSPGEKVSTKQLVELLKRPATLSALFVIFFITAGIFATYTMISPIMKDVYGSGDQMISTAFFVFGVSGFVGNVFVRSASIRWSAEVLLKASMLFLMGIYACLLVLPISLTLLIAALIVWPFVADIIWPSQQRRIIELEPSFRGLGLALSASFMFSGIAVGSAMGGVLYTHGGYGFVLALSIILISIGLVTLSYSVRARGLSTKEMLSGAI
jgi:predicted MFS family arabinose efflux permease